MGIKLSNTRLTASAGTSGGSNFPLYAGISNTFAIGSAATTPVTVDSCAITVPASSVARTFMVNGFFLHDGSHPNYVQMTLDGVLVQANSTNQPASVLGYNVLMYSAILQLIVTVPGDSATHTIALAYQAADEITGFNFYDRNIIATQVA